MSGTVQDGINRANRLEYFKSLLATYPNMTVPEAIKDAYPRLKKSDRRYAVLVRAGIQTRKDND